MNDETNKVHLKKMDMRVKAEGKIKEGLEKVQLEELKVFETSSVSASAPKEVQITFYTFDDGHIEVYEDALQLLFAENTADQVPHKTMLIRGELARPMNMPGNNLVRLELEDGTQHGEPLDEEVIRELNSGSTPEVRAVFDRELKPFPEHQFVVLDAEFDVKPEVKPNTSAVEGGKPLPSASSTRRANKSSKSIKSSIKSSRSRHAVCDKDKVTPVATLKKVANRLEEAVLKPNAVRDGPRVASGRNKNNKDGGPDVIIDVTRHDGSEEENPEASRTAGDVPAVPERPSTSRRKSEKTRRQKPSENDSPMARTREDGPATLQARCSPRLKSLDKNVNSVNQSKKMIKKVKASKNLSHAKTSSKKSVDTSSEVVDTVPDLEKIPSTRPKTLPKQIPTPVPVLVKPAESETPALSKPVPVRPSFEQAMLDIDTKNNKKLPRHQSLRIALRTFRNKDVKRNRDVK